MRPSVFLAVFILCFLSIQHTSAQDNTVGLLLHDDRAFDGYTLFSPLFNRQTYLIDNDGQLIHSWEHGQLPGAATYLLPNGNLLHAAAAQNSPVNFGGQGGLMKEVDWDGNVVWEFAYSDSLKALHHDMAVLPNGNVLMIAWERKSFEEAVAAGRDSTLLEAGEFWPEEIIEVRPTPPEGGEIVWEWNVWDHLIQDFDSTKDNFGVVEDHPELVDINQTPAPNGDWLHFNSINYNAELDQIIISAPGFNELWVIDHSTTTEEAAGHTGGNSGKGGDLLYRWGNPAAYRATDPNGRQLYFQHDVQWIEPGLPGAGNILLFNNSVRRNNQSFSSILEIDPAINSDGDYTLNSDGAFDFGEIVWQYEEPDSFWSDFASGVQRLPNGNTLIAEAQTGRIFEITSESEIVWSYVNPVTHMGPLVQGDSIPTLPGFPWRQFNAVFRAYRYAPDYAGLQGRDLTPKGLIELTNTSNEEPGDVRAFTLEQNYPNPFSGSTSIPFHVTEPRHITLSVYNILGQKLETLVDRFYGPGEYRIHFEAGDLPAGIYFYRIESEDAQLIRKMTVVR